MRCPILYIWLICLFSFASISSATIIASGTPSAIDGTIDGAYTHLTEDPFAGPTSGGSATDSDSLNELSASHAWDGVLNNDIFVGFSRGDIQQLNATWDASNLYLTLSGPTIHHNSFSGGDARSDNDYGDVFIAVDAGSYQNAASGSLATSAGWGNDASGLGFSGAKAVDFDGWTPNGILAVQYVDNGGGGGGYAEWASLTGGTVAGGGQGTTTNGFSWQSDLANTMEFSISWQQLGYAVGFDPTQPGTLGTVRLAAYTTANYNMSDAFDSGPGFGNVTLYEEIGDSPGDPDSGGQLGASDPGSFAGSLPGANEIGGGPTNVVGHADGIDTIEGYISFDFGTLIPEPSSVLLFGLGILFFIGRRR